MKSVIKYDANDGSDTDETGVEEIIDSVQDAIRKSPHTTDVRHIDISGSAGTDRACLISGIVRRVRKTVFVVVDSVQAAESAAQDLSFFGGPSGPAVRIFPPYNILPFKRLSYHSETAARRIRVLYELAASHDSPSIVVVPVETLLQRIIPKNVLCGCAEPVMVNEEIDRDRFIARLHAGGYVHASIVEEPGEYSIRGGIIDVYCPLYDDPLRIELFGDTVDSIRRFSATTQRKTDTMDEAVILPAREAVFETRDIQDIIRRARKQKSASGITESAVTGFIERLGEEGVFPGIEGLLPLIYDSPGTVFDYMAKDTLIVQYDPAAAEKEALRKESTATRNYLSACEDNRMCVTPESVYLSWEQVKDIVSGRPVVSFRMIQVRPSGATAENAGTAFKISAEENPELSSGVTRGRDERLLSPLADWLEAHEANGYQAVIVCSTRFQAERIQGLLEPYGKHPEIISSFSDISFRLLKPVLLVGHLSGGVVFHDLRLAIITEKEIFGSRPARKTRSESRRAAKTAFLDFSDLNTDDLVVHIAHGIGQYRGLEKLTIDNITSDFMIIEYKEGDKLYLPVDRMDMVQKYLGVDDAAPVIDKLGGTAWQKTKAKVRKSVEKIANDLLSLYARRKVETGHAFAGDDAYYRDFEAGFAHEETEDQIKAIEEVLADMQTPAPMDRLICGDVGYGKTEVALRAAFKAVNDGKQVAVMVPTTLLAEQHLRTFTERFEKYPVTVECISRFRSRKEQKQIVERAKTGVADILIGTHRLLQKDIGFRDLGLIIIDEEQRFGVRHKEKLKKMRSTVDVLSMTATPIPRTLHMSMLGVRDISVISTPPELRRPIISYISELDPAVIAEAIRRELDRGGQVFFVHNNIHTIWNMSKYLKDLVPEVKLGVAHGRLGEDELESVMQKFIHRQIDMLVTTTIVESGLDIPNANTIIINRAERFGLSQIYQLRGRVGRAGEQAYAHLIVPGEAGLSRDAQKRLKVLMEHSDLGAGFQIALNDLKIRGGGAALGIDQSGHVSAVGYDMFLQLMEESIAKLKGETVTETLEPEINIPVSVYIPESYIPDLDGRLTAYRRLSRMKELREVADFREELIDRYGKLPTEVIHLVLKIMLRILAKKAGVKRIDMSMETLSMAFSEIHQKNPRGIIDMIASEPERFRVTPSQTLVVVLQKSGINNLMNQSKKVLMEIADHVNK